MEQTELTAMRERLQRIIKECREMTKIIDNELECKASEDKAVFIPHNADLLFRDHSQLIIDTFERKDIDIFIADMVISSLQQVIYSFNLIKDRTITTLHVRVDQMEETEQAEFMKMLQARFKPKSTQHLKALINKAYTGVSNIKIFVNGYGRVMFINVVSTTARQYNNVRHRNTTYLFDTYSINLLDHHHQQFIYRNNAIKTI